jgi:hypothetical protein
MSMIKLKRITIKADRGTISRVLSRAFISLGCRLLDTSCSLPEGMTNRTDSWQSEDRRSFCLALLPMGFTQPARLPEPLVRSYRTVSPLPPAAPCGTADRRFAFCCTCPILTDGGRYPPSCPVEPGLSSESYDSANACPSVSHAYCRNSATFSNRVTEMTERSGMKANSTGRKRIGYHNATHRTVANRSECSRYRQR